MCRAIETVRKIDSVTPIVVEPNCHASPRGFDVKNIYGLKGFEPLPYDNLIYSVHVYTPMDYTHQGLFQKKEDYKPRPYPGRGRLRDPNRKRYAGDLGDEDESKDVWDKDFLRREIQSVRDFQLATGARIFVGEFSAAAYAPGADAYLKDLCEIFGEYGWDWTYHAFRESTCWSLEHEGESFHELKPAKEKTPRAKVIEKFLKKTRPQHVKNVPHFRRVMFCGNSLMCHGPNAGIGWTNNWGMAASRPDWPDGYGIDRRAVERDGKIELTLRPCGGYCARISPAKGRRICRSSRSISTRRSTTSSTWVDRYHYTAAGYELLASQVVKRVSAARVCSASGLEGENENK
jgi:hypothetical protein